jgi:heme/copper-type cytochrome/quinol oxidase subunit 2
MAMRIAVQVLVVFFCHQWCGLGHHGDGRFSLVGRTRENYRKFSPEKLKSKTRQQDHRVMENHQLIDDINKNGYPYIYIILYIYI